MTTIYGTQVTTYYTTAQAAFAAGGSPLNIAGGSVVVGDGGGTVPLLSQLIANGGCLNPLAGTGAEIVSVAEDLTNSAQIDIGIVVPATVGGVETGPFTVREFCVYDVLGNLCAVGVTNLEKSTSAQGQIADLAWTASIVTAVAGAVTVTPPSSGFATMLQVQGVFNDNLPTASAPLTQASTVNSSGWVERVFGIRAASQPADPVTAPEDQAATGYGRPASAAEFSSGAPFSGGFAFPWPTIQQVHAALNAITASITAITASITAVTASIAAVTASIAALFLASVAPNGYQKLPSGLIIQWGSGTLPASGVNTSASPVTFPIAFPSQLSCVVGSLAGPANNPGGYWSPFTAASPTRTGFYAQGDTLNAGTYPVYFNVAVPFAWIAIGY